MSEGVDPVIVIATMSQSTRGISRAIYRLSPQFSKELIQFHTPLISLSLMILHSH
jgi:hypothetical protein